MEQMKYLLDFFVLITLNCQLTYSIIRVDILTTELLVSIIYVYSNSYVSYKV